ncbi:MAG: roadblock/LC7 domain-containing protein [Planctomycetota bacterium]
MNHALEMLAALPGVRHVMLVTADGVPAAFAGRSRGGGARLELEAGDELASLGAEDALAALATGLVSELGLAVGPMSWNSPQRMVLRAARGTLALQALRGAVLVVLLERGMRAEEMRLSMDGTIARIERTLRGMGGPDQARTSGAAERGARAGHTNEPPGPLPFGGEDEDVPGPGKESRTEEREPGSPQARH